MLEQVRGRPTAAVCLLLFLAAWAGSLAYLAAVGSSISLPLISMAAVGVVLPALAILLTRGAKPPPVPVEHPGRELVLVVGFLIVYAFYFLGWASGAVRDATRPGAEQDAAMLLLKVGVSVSAPSVMLYLAGAQLGPLFDLGLRRKGIWTALLVIGPILMALVAFTTGSAKVAQAFALPAQTLAWAAPLTFAWVALEVGLTEEFLYRAVLQSRLWAALGSATGAVLLSSLLYALAHVPGIYLRGGPDTPGYSPDLTRIVAYCVAVMAPVGVLYGTLWARTRSLALVVLAHACVSTLPRIAEFAANWS